MYLGAVRIVGTLLIHPESPWVHLPTYGKSYVDQIRDLRPLLDSRSSPWNNIPFPTPEQFVEE